jgi:2-dehydro-3-deoxyphosphogluconate aldolase/(4S)-4-hydroxy-2-oxoglutarate aldolase
MNEHRRHQVTGRILECGIVAVIRADSAELAEQMAHACLDGGIEVIEVALTTPDAFAVIRSLTRTLEPRGALFGAGTVLDEASARLAIDAGAKYVVTPSLVREVVAAMEAGADIVKLFPGESLGPRHLRALKAPLPHAPLMPTGGVDAANAPEWIAAGAVALGVGGSLTGPALRGDLPEVTRRAQALVTAVAAAREDCLSA